MNMFRFEMKRQAKGLFWWTAVLCLLLFVYLSAFPSMRDIAVAKFEALPDQMLAAFNIDPSLDLTDFNQYFAMIYSYMLLGLACYAAILGTNALSREENEGTIEFLNSQAVSRSAIVTAKLLAALTSLGVVGAGLTLVSYLGGTMFGTETLDMPAVFAVIKMSFVPVLVYLALGFVLSTLVPRSTKGTSIALALFFGTYVAGVIASIVEDLAPLKWISPMQYVLPGDVLDSTLGLGTAAFDWTGVLLGAALTVAGLTTTYLIYRRKDLHSK